LGHDLEPVGQITLDILDITLIYAPKYVNICGANARAELTLTDQTYWEASPVKRNFSYSSL